MSDDLDATHTPDATLRSNREEGRAEALPALGAHRYEIDTGPDAQLGKGGQGVVWRARDGLLRREVALKLLRPDAAADPAVLGAFLREARLTAMLEHPGIVPLYDLGTGVDGAPALVLRRIEGRTLAQLLGDTRTLEERLRLVPVMLRACQAVAFAHHRGVVHRDLKPQNVMVGEFGQTYVVDWGLANVHGGPLAAQLTDAIETPGVVGTPAYMSPEQALGLAADARSDVWGLGACLYQLLTGAPPLAGNTIESVLGRAAEANVVPAPVREPGVPRDLAAICHKALAAERAERYPSAVALADDLEAWLTGRTVSAREYSRLELLRRALAANRVAVAIALVAVVAFAVVLAVNELRLRSERNDARLFARKLLIDSSHFAQVSTPDADFLAVLTNRSREWLARHDLDVAERRDLCAVLVSVASLYRELGQKDEERGSLVDAVRLAEAGLAAEPDSSPLFACRASARTDLAWGEVMAGQREAAAAFGPLEQELRAWQGPPDPQLSLALADLLGAWADTTATTEPRRSAERSVAAALEAQRVVTAPGDSSKAGALAFGSLGVSGLWGLGRRDEAMRMAREFAEAARPLCSRKDDARRTCQLALDSYRQQLAWRGDPAAVPLEAEVVALEAELSTRSPGSRVLLQNMTYAAFERGDFKTSARAGLQLLELGETTTGRLGVLAAVLDGQALPDQPSLDPEEPVVHLATAFSRVSSADWHGAAQALRATAQPDLWFRVSWTPHPKPALTVPPPARPAWDRFVAEFTRAYGEADSPALERSLLELAAALEALPD